MPKNTSSAASQIAQVQKIRRKQIEKLKQQKLTVSVIHRDVQYRVDFSLKQENQIYYYCMIIDLPPAFPSEAPMLFIHPPCSHKYLDAAQMVFKFPPLDNFKGKPDLAFVVKRLISEFEKKPPIPLLYPDYLGQFDEDAGQFSSATSYQQEYPDLSSPTTAATSTEPQRTSAVDDLRLPEVIPELEDLSIDELKEINADENLLLDVYHRTEMASKLKKERDEISARIEEVANANLTCSEKLEKSREDLMKAFENCRKLKEDYDANMEKYRESSEWLSLHNLSLTLQVSAAEKEEEAEKIAEKFLEGDLDVGDFTKEFVKTKALATRRKAKEDKILHLISSS